MTDMEPLRTLIECLRNNDVTINRDELQAALQEEHSPAIRHWIDEHLGPDTLLTRDEFVQ
jgi:macrodomain Ter protein organizer (MatP/YcbG family)